MPPSRLDTDPATRAQVGAGRVDEQLDALAVYVTADSGAKFNADDTGATSRSNFARAHA